ncbi:diguanylate cyclase [Aliiglaciecola sp. LCG003]|uniref:diguanylate cyclase n=1 Tax=Aliiglaciecola sp. LCG003 TaxID=3053655 RepID=UPI0025727E61|nr:diguanylate cyclase [Aliiglaciecola sp. LCG003]WJG07640.1 diguanylate cyclase [Aliiglaciecola sp. LCG003]
MFTHDFYTESEKFLDHARILIVDDHDINLEIIKAHLSPLYDVYTAKSGEEALEFCYRKQPDLVIMDVQMPGMGGLKACQYIKNEPVLCNIPVLFATALDKPSDEATCWNAGGSDFITKPISPETLLNRVKAQLKYKLQTDTLREFAFLDGLTGIYNRRYFDDCCKRQVGLANRKEQPLSLLMIDIDYFKQYNDHFGHLAGDDTLKVTAEKIVTTLKRPTDFACRYGGEEFACLLPDTDKEGAAYIAEELIRAVNSLKIYHPKSPFNYVSISVGIGCIDEQIDTGDLLINSADKQLYKAKNYGRKCWA